MSDVIATTTVTVRVVGDDKEEKQLRSIDFSDEGIRFIRSYIISVYL
jgi:hypothetical protein